MSGWEDASAIAETQGKEWEQMLTSNPKVLWGLVADVVKAVKAAEGDRKTGRRPAASVTSLDELYELLFPKRYESSPFPVALHMALGSKSQRTFAEEVGINQATISRLLSGKTPPTVEMMERAAYVLKIPPTYFAEYRAMKLAQILTDVLMANPEMTVEALRRFARVSA